MLINSKDYILHEVGELSRAGVLDVGLKCPHACKFCYYSYLDGSDNQFSGMRKAEFRSKEECFKILDGLKANGFISLDITGGEPTIHRNIVDIIRYAELDLDMRARLITLGQFLTQENPLFYNNLLIDELLSAGLTNFLFSMHAVDEDLFKKSTGGSWKKLLSALNYLDEKDFHYTANTTIFEWNNKKLPDIARESLKHNIYVHNFIIMNAYYEWNKDGKAFGIQAKYSKIHPYLQEAVQILEEGKVAVNIRYAPLCAVKGMERNLSGIVGVRYDPYEWMNNGGHNGGTPEHCAKKINIEKGDIEPHIRCYDTIGELDNKTIITGRRGDKVKYFTDKCSKCNARKVCDGIDYNYLNIYGDSEFEPYSELNTSPLHIERTKYLPAFAVKTNRDANMKSVIANLFEQMNIESENCEESILTINDTPLVSIIIPCYNYGKYLSGAVKSVINQSYKNFEIIIVNDGSDDDTIEQAEKLIKEYNEINIRLINQANSGQPAISRNVGIQNSNGKYVLPLDADDEIAPEMLFECVKLLESNPDISIAYVDNEYFGDECKIVNAGEPFALEKLKLGNFLSYCSMFKKEVWEKAGGYRTNVKGYEDWDFWIEAAKNKFSAKRIAKPLFKYRIHNGLLKSVLKNDQINIANIVLNRKEVFKENEIKRAEKIAELNKSFNLNLIECQNKIYDLIQSGNIESAEILSAIMLSRFYEDASTHEIRAGILRITGDYRNAQIMAQYAYDNHNSLLAVIELFAVYKKSGENSSAENIKTELFKYASIENFDIDGIENIDTPIFYLLNDSYMPLNSIQERPKEQSAIDKEKYVNICSVTFNRLEFTKQMIDGLLKHTSYPYVLTIVDNNSQDGTKEYLKELKNKGVIKNLILLDENIGVAPAANIAWKAEPNADYYLKLDNDIVIYKDNWLENLVYAVDSIDNLGAVGYNFEEKSYPIIETNNMKLRPKHFANIGGACYLIPKRIEEKFGYWCEDYSPYGEEDGDYSLRLRLGKYFNAYLEDENIGIHLPSGKAGTINPLTLEAEDYIEKETDKEYREWKDRLRAEIQKKGGLLHRNILMYMQGLRTLFVPQGILLGVMDSKIQVFKKSDGLLFLPLDNIVIEEFRDAIINWLNINGINNSNLVEENLYHKKAYCLKLNGEKLKSNEEKTISVIIPTFNRADLTEKCLNAMYNLVKPKIDFETIIIDNSSTDNSAELLKSWSEREDTLHYQINDSNLGFAKACNIGANLANGKYLLFLNNDTIPLEGWLDNLYSAFSKFENLGAVGSKLLYPTGKIQHAGIEFNENGIPYHIYRNYDKRQDEVRFEKYYPAVTGASILIPKEIFESAGGFDESYSMYVEDVDLCMKIWDMGYKVLYYPKSELIHLESASITDIEKRDQMVRDGWTKLLIKWHDKFNLIKNKVEFANKNIVLSDSIGENMNTINYCAPIYDPSGYADDARNLLNQLLKYNMPIHIQAIGRHSESFKAQCDSDIKFRLDRAINSEKAIDNYINIIHFPAYAYQRIDNAKYNIGRLVFETDSLPDDWIEKCNQMDEIWTSTNFNVETFKNSGIQANIFKVPQGVDAEKFSPYCEPLKIEGAKGFVFLSIFEWTQRKGWDILLKSWARAFKANDNVSLVLRTYLPNAIDKNDSSDEINKIIDKYLLDCLGIMRDEIAPIIVLGEEIPDSKIPNLYASASAYISPTRGEGWGRPLIEAMACGLPTIATRWGGALEFMNDENSFLIEIDGLETIDDRMEFAFYKGQKWAIPSELSVVQLMRQVYSNPNGARFIGMKARDFVKTNFTWENAAKFAMERIKDIMDGKIIKRSIEKKTETSINEEKKQLNIVWEGSQLVFHSLALVNRELCNQIIESGVAELTIIPYEPDQFSAENNSKYLRLQEYDIRNKKDIPDEVKKLPYVWIRHQWPPKHEAPKGAKWIVMQPWEYSEHRIDLMDAYQNADEIWTPSNHSRESFVRSGVDFNKVQIIPNGINPEVFKPYGKKIELPTKKRIKFLYVGGTIYRKGIDILLDAYTRAFTNEDDVCLIIKDLGGDTFYKGQTAEQRIKRIKENPNAPEIIYAHGNMPEDEMPDLYRACDVFVSPYRAEGFSLPTLEAMACGLPVIVTENGSTDDFVDNEVGWTIPSRKVYIGDNYAGKKLTGNAFIYEPDANELENILKEVCANNSIKLHKGILAQRRARKEWNWRNAAIKLFSRLDVMCNTNMAICAENKLTPYEDIYTIFGSAEFEYKYGDIDSAIELYTKIIAETALRSDYRLLAFTRLALLSLAGGDTETAKAFTEFAESIDNSSPDIIYIKARIQSYQADYETALETITPLLDNWMDMEQKIQTELSLDLVLCATADIMLNMNDFDSALQIYTKALEINNENSDACFGAGVCLYNMEALEDAEKMWRWALKHSPNYLAAQEALKLLVNISSEEAIRID